MALTKQSMATKILAYMDAVAGQQFAGSGDASAYRRELLEAMCQGIIDEIVQNGEVIVDSVTGVEPGGGVSGPGTGTIT